MIQQKIILRPGQKQPVQTTWEIGENFLRQTVPWAKDKKLLAKELEEMEEYFPFFLATVAEGNSIVNCPKCGDLIVWKDELECAACGQLFNPPMHPQLVLLGQIPSIIGEIDEDGKPIPGKCRPILKRILEKMASVVGRDKEVYGKYIAQLSDGKCYFIPQVRCFYPDNWSRSAPLIVLEREYFRVIDLQPDHVFPDNVNGGYQLCNYASWPRTTLRMTLQQRIVPRIIIDLMLADLKVVGKLDRVLNNLGTSLHGVYNFIGKGERSLLFKREYERYVSL